MLKGNGNPFEADFLQGSGSNSQMIPAANTPVQVVIDTLDAANNISLDPTTGTVKVEDSGPYVIIAAPQVGRTIECLKNTPNFRCWLRVNGVNVVNSNVLLNVTRDLKDVIVAQSIIELEEGDEVSVMMSSNYGGVVGVEAIKPEGEPLIPSIIFSIFKLTDKPGKPIEKAIVPAEKKK